LEKRVLNIAEKKEKICLYVLLDSEQKHYLSSFFAENLRIFSFFFVLRAYIRKYFAICEGDVGGNLTDFSGPILQLKSM